MSRRPSRPLSATSHSSRSSNADTDFKLECKAAYLTVLDDMKDDITSQDDFILVLQQTGRNPSRRTLEKYWKEDTESITFNEFVDICRREHATNADDLIKAFKKIDINGDGYISLDELLKTLTTKGDRMSRDEVRAMIDEVDENKDGRLDYSEFCNMMMKTTEECKKMSIKMMERKERRKQRNRTSITPRKDEEDDIHSSRTSLRSGSSQLKNTADKMGSQVSITSNSKSVKDTADKMGSRVSITSNSKSVKDTADKMGSQVSITSNSKSVKDTADKMGSQVSITSNSKSVKDTPDKMGSQVSITSNSKSVKEVILTSEFSDASDRRSSKSSFISIDDLPKPSPRVKEWSRQALKSRLPEPSNLKSWTHVYSKGCFFLEDDKILSHQYTLDLPDETNVWITISPLNIGEGGVSADGYPIDTGLFILSEKARSHGQERVITFTEQRDSRGKFGVRCDLNAGKYELIPFTTGCRLRPSKPHKSEPKLVHKDKRDEYVLTKAFKKALDEIFEMADLDGNGLLSREELNLYTWRTSGEEVVDEEWAVVEANCDLEGGEITKAGFIHLTEMEAQDTEGEDKDLWITLENMGYNRALVLAEACPFMVDVYAEECDHVKLKVSTLEPADDHVEEAVCESVISKGESTKIKGMRDLTLYNYISDARATLAIKNSSSTQVLVELDCKNSRNCISHRGSLRQAVSVPAHSTVVGHHLIPDDEKSEWTVRCIEKILKS